MIKIEYIETSNEVQTCDDSNHYILFNYNTLEQFIELVGEEVSKEYVDLVKQNYVEPVVEAIPMEVIIEQTVSQIKQAVQDRLDSFARTRNYDGILSATTYANSKIEQFQKEGQYATDVRDQTWAVLTTFMIQVQQGLAPMPNSYADVEPLLPVLEWPQ